MPKENKAEKFIRILTEMLDEERARRANRLRLQQRAYADRFMTRLRSDFEDRRTLSEWFRRGEQPELVAVRTNREEPACTYSFITRNHNS